MTSDHDPHDDLRAGHGRRGARGPGPGRCGHVVKAGARNPDGIVYPTRPSAASRPRKPAAPDFLLMWDNAYCIHEFEGDHVPFPRTS